MVCWLFGGLNGNGDYSVCLEYGLIYYFYYFGLLVLILLFLWIFFWFCVNLCGMCGFFGFLMFFFLRNLVFKNYWFWEIMGGILMFFYGVMMYFLFSKNWFLFVVVVKVIFIIFVKVCFVLWDMLDILWYIMCLIIVINELY